MKIAYYITAHGFGHGVRACVLVNCLSPEVKVVFRTALPRSFFSEEVKRPFEYDPKSFDCGCVQSDGVTVDVGKTVFSYKAISETNAGELSREIAWCKENHIDGIISDIAPFAFEVARGAGIASIAATNFTWYDVYKEYCTAYPDFIPYVEKIKEQYGMADLLLELTPSLSMEYFNKRKRVGPVGRSGANVRRELIEQYGIPPEKRLGLIYGGTFGMDSISWSKLDRFKEWEFFGLYPLPRSPANYHIAVKKNFHYEDIIASMDCMIGKIGYGVYAECVLNGVPLIYLPREEFAEYPALEKAIIEWGGGHCLSREDYCGLAWDAALFGAISRPRPRPVRSDGAMTCAKEIEKILF